MERQQSVTFIGIDSDTPLNEPLSAKYMRTFAYHTVKDRLPVILTKVVDHLARDKDDIIAEFGPDAEDEIKTAIGQISKMKNEVQTNKPLVEIESDGADVDKWNKYLAQVEEREGQACWFESNWLYVENYLYRRLRQIFEKSKSLRDFDPFLKQKSLSFPPCLPLLPPLSRSLSLPLDPSPSSLQSWLKVCLWGNRCDLSLSNGAAPSAAESSGLGDVSLLDACLLCDESERVFEALNAQPGGIVDLIHDNAAYELFTDFCLSDYLISSGLASHVRFHVKAMPWYVSDVTRRDHDWLMTRLKSEHLSELSLKWCKYFDEGKWSLHEESYWTLPFDYNDVMGRDPELYQKLSEGKLIIFKGDLNYRKLLGDLNWGHGVKFDVALRGFKPTSVLALRTVKADLICGIDEGRSKELTAQDANWMCTGQYGVIQFYKQTS